MASDTWVDRCWNFRRTRPEPSVDRRGNRRGNRAGNHGGGAGTGGSGVTAPTPPEARHPRVDPVLAAALPAQAPKQELLTEMPVIRSFTCDGRFQVEPPGGSDQVQEKTSALRWKWTCQLLRFQIDVVRSFM